MRALLLALGCAVCLAAMVVDGKIFYDTKHPSTPIRETLIKENQGRPSKELMRAYRTGKTKLRDADGKDITDEHLKKMMKLPRMYHADPEFCDEVNLNQLPDMLEDTDVSTEYPIRDAIKKKIGGLVPVEVLHWEVLEERLPEEDCVQFYREVLVKNYRLDYTPVRDALKKVMDVVLKYYKRERFGDIKTLHDSIIYLGNITDAMEAYINNGDDENHPNKWIDRTPAYDAYGHRDHTHAGHFAEAPHAPHTYQCNHLIMEYARESRPFAANKVLFFLARELRLICDRFADTDSVEFDL